MVNDCHCELSAEPDVASPGGRAGMDLHLAEWKDSRFISVSSFNGGGGGGRSRFYVERKLYGLDFLPSNSIILMRNFYNVKCWNIIGGKLMALLYVIRSFGYVDVECFRFYMF